MWTAPGDNEAGLRIVIQSERGPVYLEERVEAFLDHMKGVIESMTDEQFAEQKSGLERKWREAPKNLNEEVSRHWAHIDSGYLDFLRRKCLVLLDGNNLVTLNRPTTHRHRGR
jgi:insulysin